jgi:hypothetical protein
MRRRSNFNRSSLTPAGCPMLPSIDDERSVVTMFCNSH